MQAEFEFSWFPFSLNPDQFWIYAHLNTKYLQLSLSLEPQANLQKKVICSPLWPLSFAMECFYKMQICDLQLHETSLVCWPLIYPTLSKLGSSECFSLVTLRRVMLHFSGVQWGWASSWAAVLWFLLTIVVSAIEPKLLMKMLQLTFTGGPAWQTQNGTAAHCVLVKQRISTLCS